MTKIPAHYQRWTILGILGMFLLSLPMMVFGLVSSRIETRGRAAEEATPSSDGCQTPPSSLPTNFTAANGGKIGEVMLSWDQDLTVDHYGLVFGQSSSSYQFGLSDIGNVNQFLVKQLSPGKRYYFAIAAFQGCASSGLSQEVSVLVTGSEPIPSPTPTVSLYQPAEEVLSVLVPTTAAEIWPTLPPLPIREPQAETWPNAFINQILTIGLFSIVIIIFLFFLWLFIKKILPKPTPKIILPPKASLPSQLISLSHKGKKH